MNLHSIKILMVAAFFTVPVLLGMSRDAVLQSLVHMLDVGVVEGRIVEDRHCRGEVCRLVYEVELANHEEDFAAGYYSAFGESLVSRRAPSKEWQKSIIDINWYNFIVKTLPVEPQSEKSTIWIECFTNTNSKKLGLETNRIFVGRENSIRILAFIFDLFSVHLYLLLALGSILIGAIFSLTKTMESRILEFSDLFEGGMIAVALVGYSHILDSALIGFGISTQIVQVFPRAFLGISILHFFLDNEKVQTRRLAIGLYLLLVLPGALPFSFGRIFLFGIYKWVVAGVTVVTCVRVLRGKNSRILSLYCLLMAVDVLVIHGLLQLRSGLYLSPLALPGLLITKHSQELMQVINRNMIFLRSIHLKSRLDAAKSRHLQNELDWNGFLKESLYALRDATSSLRIAIFFKQVGSPIILSLKGREVFSIADGHVPPLFARVLQTKNEYWWIDAADIQRILGPHVSRQREDYQSDCAIIVPIVVGGEVYGIVSLTDFRKTKALKTSVEERQYVEAMTRTYVDLIAAELIVRQERDNHGSEIVANRLMETFIANASLSIDRASVVTAFIDALVAQKNLKIIFFEFDLTSRTLALLTSRNLTAAMLDRWSKIPLHVSPENYINRSFPKNFHNFSRSSYATRVSCLLRTSAA